MPKVKRSTKSKTLKTGVPENLDPLYMDDLRSLCRKLNLPDTGRRNTLCRRLKLHKKQLSPPAKQDQRSKEPDPVALPKTGSGLTWLTEKQKTELTSLIQDSIQSAIGNFVSQTTKRVLEVVRPSLQPSGQQDEDPMKPNHQLALAKTINRLKTCFLRKSHNSKKKAPFRFRLVLMDLCRQNRKAETTTTK